MNNPIYKEDTWDCERCPCASDNADGKGICLSKDGCPPAEGIEMEEEETNDLDETMKEIRRLAEKMREIMHFPDRLLGFPVKREGK